MNRVLTRGRSTILPLGRRSHIPRYALVCLLTVCQYNDEFVKCPKISTTPPRCHSDQVDPLVCIHFINVSAKLLNEKLMLITFVFVVIRSWHDVMHHDILIGYLFHHLSVKLLTDKATVYIPSVLTSWSRHMKEIWN